MQIAKVRVSNVLGIAELEFDAGKFNEIAGPNGSGKTSVLEAIKSVIKGGEDATLIRHGAERGEVVLVIDDGTEIKRRMTPKTTTTVVERNGVRVPKPAEAIKALTDMLSVNPIDFLRTPAKKRVDVLLDSLPMTADPARLAEIVGREVKVNPNLPALVTIDAVRKEVFDDRTGTSRAVREKEATINQLAATLPDGAVDVPTGATDLVAKLAEIDASKDAELGRIATKLDGFRREKADKLQAIRDAAEAEIAELQRKIDARREQMRAEVAAENDALAEIERRAGAQREKKLGEFAEQRQAVSSQLAAIQAAQQQAARHGQTRETIKTMRDDAGRLAADVERQTAALASLDAYKSDLLAALPIDGLEVRDGEIFRHDITFDRLNTAQQVEVAVEIAKLRAGDLGVICVDGIELLDSAHYAAFREQALASGLQLFVTRVADGDFGVHSHDGDTPSAEKPSA